MRNIHRKDWDEYQSFASRSWHECNDYLLDCNQDTLDDLLTSSKSTEVSEFSIDTTLSYGIDMDITFNADGKRSQVWIAESINYVPNILSFLEAIVSSNYNEYFYFCDEEGPDTYLYVKRVKKDDIQFVHITQRVQFAKYIQTEDFRIRQDFVVNKNKFIKAFYTSIMNAVKNADIKEIEEECWYQTDELKVLQKGSTIIEEYIENLGLSNNEK